jgi:hypothetical protein
MSHSDSVFEICLGLCNFVGFFAYVWVFEICWVFFAYVWVFESLILFGSLKFTGFCVFWFV